MKKVLLTAVAFAAVASLTGCTWFGSDAKKDAAPAAAVKPATAAPVAAKPAAAAPAATTTAPATTK